MEYRYRRPEPDFNIWWQIALGGFIALTSHSIVVGMYVRYEAQQAMKQLSAEAAKLDRQTAKAAQYLPQPRTYTEPAHVPPMPLRQGERCMQGRRFKRVENGWIHLPHEPC